LLLESCFIKIVHFKLARFASVPSKCFSKHTATSRVEKLAQVLSCQLKIVRAAKFSILMSRGMLHF